MYACSCTRLFSSLSVLLLLSALTGNLWFLSKWILLVVMVKLQELLLGAGTGICAAHSSAACHAEQYTGRIRRYAQSFPGGERNRPLLTAQCAFICVHSRTLHPFHDQLPNC